MSMFCNHPHRNRAGPQDPGGRLSWSCQLPHSLGTLHRGSLGLGVVPNHWLQSPPRPRMGGSQVRGAGDPILRPGSKRRLHPHLAGVGSCRDAGPGKMNRLRLLRLLLATYTLGAQAQRRVYLREEFEDGGKRSCSPPDSPPAQPPAPAVRRIFLLRPG